MSVIRFLWMKQRTPLIISGPAEASTEKYYVVNKVVPHLVRDKHFTMEEKTKTASLTEEIPKLNKFWVWKISTILNILKCCIWFTKVWRHFIFTSVMDYMIKDGEVVIVDELQVVWCQVVDGAMGFIKPSKPKKMWKWKTKIRLCNNHIQNYLHVQ